MGCPCEIQDVLQITYVTCVKLANMSTVHGPCLITSVEILVEKTRPDNRQKVLEAWQM